MTDDFYLHPLSFPPRPSLEQYKKLAKDLQHACKSGDAAAVRHWAERTIETLARLQAAEMEGGAKQIEQRWREFRKGTDGAARCALAGAQLFIARAHGFSSWSKFAAHVEALERGHTPVSDFETAVDAIVSGDATRLRALLNGDPSLVRMRSAREHRSTLLHYVSANGVESFRQKTPKNIVEIAKLLLDAGADVNAESDAYGGRSTTLGLTATSCHPENAGVQIPLLELLIERGAVIDTSEGGSAVVGCLRNGRRQAAEYLAGRGARLDLEGAAGTGRLDMVQRCFNADGSLKPPASEKQMIDGFAWACEFGRITVVEFLLSHGVKADALSSGGQTGLHWAAFGAHRDIVKLLLDRGAPVDVIDKRFESKPLEWAMHGWFTSQTEGAFHEVVTLLVQGGARPDPQWFNASAGRRDLAEKIQGDARMQAALGWEMPG